MHIFQKLDCKSLNITVVYSTCQKEDNFIVSRIDILVMLTYFFYLQAISLSCDNRFLSFLISINT